MSKTVRQEDFEFCEGSGLTEAEICDLRRLAGAIEYGPTATKSAEEYWDLLRVAKMMAGKPK